MLTIIQIIITIVVFLLLLVSSYILYNNYIKKRESSYILSFIFTLSASFSLISFLILSYIHYSNTNLKEDIVKELSSSELKISVKLLLTSIFSFQYINILFILPFTFFYGEELVNEYYNIDKSDNKLINSLKYSFLTLSILFLILSTTSLLTLNTPYEEVSFKQLLNEIFINSSAGLNIIGYIVFTIYASYGLGYLPFQLLTFSKSNSKKQKEIKLTEEEIVEKIEFFKAKQKRLGRLNYEEQQKLDLLIERDKIIKMKITRLNDIIQNEYFISKLMILLNPFKFAFGILSLLLSFLVFFSIFILSLDKIINSPCGISCGFVLLDKKPILGVIEKILTFLKGNIIYIDVYVLSFILLYIFIGYVYGIVKFGLKFFCIKFSSFSNKQTSNKMMTFLLLLLSLFAFSTATILHYISREVFRLDGGLIDYKNHDKIIPYYHIIKLIFSILFSVVFVFSMSVSFSDSDNSLNEVGSKSIDLDLLCDEDEEREMLRTDI